MKQSRRQLILICLLVVMAAAVSVTRAVEIPPNGSPVFIQTTSPNAGLTVGDFYTNVNGANDPQGHSIEILVPCDWPVATPITFALYDPEVQLPNPGAPAAIDEVRVAPSDTRFTLTIPGGGTVTQTYTPAGGTNGLWVELATVNRPAGACGPANPWVLRTTTLSNDVDNAWRLNVSNDSDCTASPGTCSVVGAASSALMDNGNEINDVDGIAGSGDELSVGSTQISYQYASNACADFFFYVDALTPTITLHNFDMDSSTSITYTPPAGAPHAPVMGTLSVDSAWNGGVIGPPFPPTRVGDVVTGITVDDRGWWTGTVCIPSNNQFIFEAIQGEPLYMQQPGTPRMIVTKTDGITTTVPGASQAYTIQFTNDSNLTATPGAAENVVLRDTVPTNAAYVSCAINAPFTGTCSEAGGVVTFNINETVIAGATGTVETVVTVNAGATGTVTNTVTLDYEDILGHPFPPETATDIDTITPVGAVPRMIVAKSDGITNTMPGDTQAYTINFTNDSNLTATPGTATNVVLRDTLPVNATYVSCAINAPFTGTCSEAGGVVTFNITQNVAPGDSGSVQTTITVNAGATGTVTNTVTLNYEDTSGTPFPPASASDTDIIGVAPAPVAGGVRPALAVIDPFITKSVSPPFALPGEAVTWTITVSNPGTINVNNIAVTDNMPPEVEILSVSTSAGSGSFSGQTVTFQIGTLTPGASATMIVNARVRANARTPFVLTNQACITSGLSSPPGCATAQLTSAGSLPGTGESPWAMWRLPIFGGVIAGLALLIGMVMRKRLRIR